MKFYVCYEEYEEWSQDEGHWNKDFDTHPTLDSAIKNRNAMLGSNHYRNVSKVLKELDIET